MTEQEIKEKYPIGLVLRFDGYYMVLVEQRDTEALFWDSEANGLVLMDYKDIFEPDAGFIVSYGDKLLTEGEFDD